MPKLTPIFNSFSAGEVTPLAWGRSDVPEVFRRGVIEMTNMRPDAHGPAIRRAGTSYVGEVPGNEARAFTFRTSDRRSFYCVITDLGKLHIFDNTGAVAPPGEDTNQVLNPSFIDGDTDWDDFVGNKGSVTYAGGLAICQPGGKEGEYAGVEQGVTIADGHRQALRIITTGLNSSSPMFARAGSAKGLQDLGYVYFTGTLYQTEIWPPAGVTEIWLQIGQPGENLDREIDLVSLIDIDPSLPFVMGAETLGIEFDTPWGAGELQDIQYASAPGFWSMVLVSPTSQPYNLWYDIPTELWHFDLIAFTSQPADWGPGQWPSVIAFHQGRMWLAATALYPERFWASVSGSFDDFTMGIEDDDAMVFTLDKLGRIEWMSGVKNLLIGTAQGEHIVTSEGLIITHSDIDVEQQSAFGSANMQAMEVGTKVLYVSTDGKKLRDMTFQWTQEAWTSQDLTFASEHITTGDKIINMAFAKDPNSTVLCITRNGDMLLCAYESDKGIIGWSRYTTGGKYLAIAIGDYLGTAQPWVCVARRPGIIDLETFVHDDMFYLDGYVSQHLVPNDDVITIPHLADKTVDVLLDGAYHASLPVDSAGVLHLPQETEWVVAGLPYASKMVTLPVDFGAQTGSGAGHKKQWNKLSVRIINSIRPRINGVESVQRFPSVPMDKSQGVYNEDITVAQLGVNSYGLGNGDRSQPDDYGILTIETEFPGPLIVAAIFGEMMQSIP